MNFLQALEVLLRTKDTNNKGIRAQRWTKKYPGICLTIKDELLVVSLVGTTDINSKENNFAISISDYFSAWHLVDEETLIEECKQNIKKLLSEGENK